MMMQSTATSYDSDTGPTTGTRDASSGDTDACIYINPDELYIECDVEPDDPVLCEICNDHPPAPTKLTYNYNAFTVVRHRIKQPFKMGFKRGNRL